MPRVYYHQSTWRDQLASWGLYLGYVALVPLIACSVFSIGYALGYFFLANWILASTGVTTALACLYIGSAEEAMFRFLLYDRILVRGWAVSPKVAMVLSSIAFGAAHLMNAPWPLALPQAFGAMAFGAVACYVYRKHGLHWAIVLHAAYDWFILYWVASVFT